MNTVLSCAGVGFKVRGAELLNGVSLDVQRGETLGGRIREADLRGALKERARQEDRSVASLLRLAAQQYLRAGRESSGGNR